MSSINDLPPLPAIPELNTANNVVADTSVTPVPAAASPVDVLQVSSMSKDERSFPIVTLLTVAVVALSAAIGGMLFLTPQGRRIIGVDSSVASTSVSSTQVSTTSAASLDLTNDDAETAVNKVVEDIQKEMQSVTPEDEFADFDAQVEFGL